MKRVLCVLSAIICFALLLSAAACSANENTTELTSANIGVPEQSRQEQQNQTDASSSAPLPTAPAHSANAPAGQRGAPAATIAPEQRTAATATSTKQADAPAATTDTKTAPTSTTAKSGPNTTGATVAPSTIPQGSILRALQFPSEGGRTTFRGPGSIHNAGVACKSEQAVYHPSDETIMVYLINKGGSNESVNQNYELQKWDGSGWKEYGAWAQWAYNRSDLQLEPGGGKVGYVSLEGYNVRTEGLYRILFWCSGGNETTAFASAVFEINDSGERTYPTEELRGKPFWVKVV